jgi:hypothetical protein
MRVLIRLLPLILILSLFGCTLRYGAARSFSTSFESLADFAGFYMVPQNHMGTASHELSATTTHSGAFAHRAWVYGANATGSGLNNTNHRGYPTIQLHKRYAGGFVTPCLITLWVWLDMALVPASPVNQWFSFATFTSDSSDTWARTVLVNLDTEGHVRLMHVPFQGMSSYYFQNIGLAFPQRQWVKLEMYLDMDPVRGYAKVWQNGVLMSHAPVRGCEPQLAQAHFGLYAHPGVTEGEVYNDDLSITEVDHEPY